MKKMSLIILVCPLMLFSACKKKYTCRCQVISQPEGGTSQFTVKEKNKAEAEKKCASHSTYAANTVPQTYETYCTIK